MTKVTATQKFKMIERELEFMRKYHQKAIAAGKLDRHWAAHKMEVFEAIRLDYLHASGEEVRKYERVG